MEKHLKKMWVLVEKYSNDAKKYIFMSRVVKDFPGFNKRENLNKWAWLHRKVLAIWVIVVVWFGSGMIRFPAPGEKVIPPVRVNVVLMRAQNLRPIISLRGVTEENRRITLRADVEGKVREIVSKKGTRHAKGDRLIRLSLETRAAELSEAESFLRQRQIEYQTATKLAEKKFRSKTDVARARSALKMAKTKLEQARDRVKDTEVVAPFDCVFEECVVENGSSVRQGETLGTVLETNPIKVMVMATEKDLKAIALGNVANVFTRDEKHLRGKVTFIASASEPQTRMFKVEVDVDNPRNELRIGAPVGVDIEGIRRKVYRLSPAYLSYSDAGDLGVKVLVDNNKAQFVKIQIVSHTQNGIVVEGLPDEIRLITDGHEYVLCGVEVDPATREN